MPPFSSLSSMHTLAENLPLEDWARLIPPRCTSLDPTTASRSSGGGIPQRAATAGIPQQAAAAYAVPQQRWWDQTTGSGCIYGGGIPQRAAAAYAVVGSNDVQLRLDPLARLDPMTPLPGRSGCRNHQTRNERVPRRLIRQRRRPTKAWWDPPTGEGVGKWAVGPDCGPTGALSFPTLRDLMIRMPAGQKTTATLYLFVQLGISWLSGSASPSYLFVLGGTDQPEKLR
ncbi:hypothetical protein DFH09DRAFT_1091236 [Mycena vulgaris]|nr:hypothetical protein DFH09DRAFT_1091236 [Mycena vulgaris]